MSTLRLDTIQDQAGGNASTPDEIYNGRAKAWVNFNGDTGTGNDDVTIRSSFNVSSVNDDDTGLYTINLTNSFADTNYILLSTTASAASNTGTTNVASNETNGGASRTTSSAQIRTHLANGSNIDRTTVSVAFFS